MDKPIIEGNSIIIPSSQDYLVEVDDFIESYLTKIGVAKPIVADIAICVTELVINGIIHGNKSDPGKSVRIAISTTGKTVEVAVTDQGRGFNPENLESPVDEKNLLKEVGRGVFIVKSLMDKVDIKPSPQGTTIILTKNL